ncbi:MAG: hypothetical protein H6696_14940 [Deferribacteres bacterium]|nr:hypothetical protein [candidate division KSB1 bacterium]MCB9503224.1 hypothetical protein [Deferribacteres bacterium]
MGKSTLLENFLVSDIEKGNGCALIDPHSDLAERLLDLIPPRRTNDVIYFNPSDIEFPIAMNILNYSSGKEQALLVAGILSVFKKLFVDYWTHKQEHILRHALLTATSLQGSTLQTVSRLLTDEPFRTRIIPKLCNRTLQKFWEKEFRNFDKRQRTEAITPILNKIGQFISNPFIGPIINQRKNKLPFQSIVDEGKILIANLSKGQIGEDAMTLLGSLLITKFQLAALQRATITESERKDFYLYIDECQNFMTENSASLFAEMRKYRLNLILANQHLGQLDQAIQQSILGNVGTLISFRVGPLDAELLQEEFFPALRKKDLLKLCQYHVALKLMIDGVTSEGFTARTFPSTGKLYRRKDKIVKVSRERYSCG